MKNLFSQIGRFSSLSLLSASGKSFDQHSAESLVSRFIWKKEVIKNGDLESRKDRKKDLYQNAPLLDREQRRAILKKFNENEDFKKLGEEAIQKAIKESDIDKEAGLDLIELGELEARLNELVNGKTESKNSAEKKTEIATKNKEIVGEKTEINEPTKFTKEQCPEKKQFEKLTFSSEALERSTGLADLMPRGVVTVEIFDQNGQSLGEANRKGIGGGFFYDGGRYAAIWEEYSIKVVKTDYAESERQEKEFRGKFAENLFLDETAKDHERQEKEIIYRYALDYGIDPKFLLALRKTENGRAGREMGILTIGTEDFSDQVRLAARSIQNSAERFDKKYGESGKKFWQSPGVVSAEGLVFCSSRYCTDGSDHPGLWSEVYTRIGGPVFKITDELKKLYIDRSGRGRAFSLEEIDELIKETSGNAKKIAVAVSELIRLGERGKHCWDWADKVYKRAGFDSARIFNSSKYSKNKEDPLTAPDEILDRLRPGDWLFINNRNGVDSMGDHSGIFMGWDGDSKNRKAKFASFHGDRRPPDVVVYDLKKNPVTRAKKPIV